MYIGKNAIHSKNEIMIYIIINLLADGILDSESIRNEFNISSLTLCRYMSFLKTALVEFRIYYIDIYYDRKSKLYRCKSYVQFKSKSVI